MKKPKKRMPARKWLVVQCEDGVEYLVPYGFDGDMDLNCPALPVDKLVEHYQQKPKTRRA